MSSSRRSFAAAVALALAGCASFESDAADPSSEAHGGEHGAGDEPDSGSEYGWAPPDEGVGAPGGDEPSPFRWWSWFPDVVVLNHDTDGVTAYLRVFDPSWLLTTDRETVSLRARTPGDEPITTAIPVMEAASGGSLLGVTTADGVHGVHPYHGGHRRRGVSVHLHADHVRFVDESL